MAGVSPTGDVYLDAPLAFAHLAAAPVARLTRSVTLRFDASVPGSVRPHVFVSGEWPLWQLCLSV